MHARLSRLARRIVPALAVLVLAAGLAGCMGAGAPEVEPAPDGGARPRRRRSTSRRRTARSASSPRAAQTSHLKIASGSENKEAAEAIAYAAGEAGVTVEMHYMGSLEIRSVLEAGGADYDAVWPASSMWISLGDTGHITPKRPEHLDHARGLRHRARPCRGARLGRRVRRHGVAHHGGDPRRGGGGRALLRHDLGHAVQQRRIRLPGVPDGALGLGRAPYRRRPSPMPSSPAAWRRCSRAWTARRARLTG